MELLLVGRVRSAILGVTINSLEYAILKMTNVKRPYRSPRRREQAEETRRRILAAARRLFVARGYGGTTMETIADDAGVAVQTVVEEINRVTKD